MGGGQERVVVIIGKELVAVVWWRGYRLGFHSPRLPSEAIEKGGESYTFHSIKRMHKSQIQRPVHLEHYVKFLPQKKKPRNLRFFDKEVAMTC
jgi:hypothetical protein